MSETKTRSVQTQIQRAIDDLVDSGAERGLQVAVYQGGEQIVDAVAGVADPASGRLYASETPVYCYSVCKAAASTLVHMLAERGAFGYETRVAEVWPEFAAHGKERVTVRHVLNHTAGVPGIPLTTTIEDLCDWDKMCSAIAHAELWWEPGTKIGYHAYTFGYIVEDAPMPPDFQMPAMPPDLPMFKAAPMSLMPDAAFGNRPDTLAADIPAGGKTSARAIARMYAAILGEVDGVRLLSPDRLREATTKPVSGVDEVFGMPTTWALGYSIGVPGTSPQETQTAFGVGGVGGSFAFGDAATGIAFAMTKNRLANNFNAAAQIIGLVTKRPGRA